ncbi:MAG: hypothetical protein ACRCYY_00330 [Trueperaceae bacterium]
MARREELMVARAERALRGGQKGNKNASKNESATVADSFSNKQLADGFGLGERTYRSRKAIGSKITEETAAVLDEMIESGVASELPDSTRQLNYLAGVDNAENQLTIVTMVASGEARDVFEAAKQVEKAKADDFRFEAVAAIKQNADNTVSQNSVKRQLAELNKQEKADLDKIWSDKALTYDARVRGFCLAF